MTAPGLPPLRAAAAPFTAESSAGAPPGACGTAPTLPAVALGALLLAAAAGCGISPDGPVAAGPPASGIPQPGAESPSARLYFAGSHGVRAVTRPADRAPGPQRALDLLLEGPLPAERERGLTSRVPPMSGQLTATATEGAVDVLVPLAVGTGELDVTAISQIACTAAHAEVPGDLPAARVDIRIHENLVRAPSPWTVRCGPGGHVAPVAE